MPSPPGRSACAGSPTSWSRRRRERSARRGSSSRTPGRLPGTTCSPPTTGSTSSATRSTGTGCARPSAAGAGGAHEAELAIRAPIPPGRYRLAFDLVLEHRYWLSEIGNAMLEVDVNVLPRDASGAVAHLPPEVEPAADWHERVRAAHEEGYAAVGGSLDAGRDRELRAYRPGGGRNPAFPSRSSARRSCRRSSRTARSPACRPGSPRATSPGSTTRGSQLDCDPIVDAAEDPRAEAERDDRRPRTGRRRPRRAGAVRRTWGRAARRSAG